MPSDSSGDGWWEYDPKHDPPGGLLHAVYLLNYFRDAGALFTAYGCNLDVAPPVEVPQLLDEEDILELDECQPLIIALLKLEAEGLSNLQRAAGVPEDALENLSLPPEA